MDYIKDVEFLRISQEYEEAYMLRFGSFPKFIPTGFIENGRLPNGVEAKRSFSRTWMKNPNYKKPRGK